MSQKIRVAIGSIAVVAFAAAGFAGTSLAAPAHHPAAKKVKGTVAFISPETYTGRWVRDKAYIQKELHKLAPKVKLLFYNGNNSVSNQQTEANQAVTAGAKVVILAAVDQNLDAPIVNTLEGEGVHVVAYDRMIQTPRLDAYASFNGPQVGVLQGKWLAAHVKKHGTIVQIWGSSDDNNAHLFLKGFDKIFKPLFKKHVFKNGYETWTPGWVPTTAGTEIDQALSQLHNKVAAVYSMNDGMADDIEPALARVGLAGIPLTGQDGQPSALARILLHTQGETIYKPLTEEANPSAKAAVYWLSGHKGTPPGFNTKAGQSKQTNGHRVPSAIGPVLNITIKNVGFPVKDGFTTWAAVCADIAGAPVKPYCGKKH